jgi:hypothetical protein
MLAIHRWLLPVSRTSWIKGHTSSALEVKAYEHECFVSAAADLVQLREAGMSILLFSNVASVAVRT